MDIEAPSNNRGSGSPIKRKRQTEAWQQEAENLFKNDPERYGSPDAPTKQGLLALAKLGKNIWIAWRRAHPIPPADFSGIDFVLSPVDFSGFEFPSAPNEFGYCVNFNRSIFGDDQSFSGAIFGGRATFANAQFRQRANFSCAIFHNNADFRSVNFGPFAKFNAARFGFFADFSETKFETGAQFKGSIFGESASFILAIFRGWSDFSSILENELPEKAAFSAISFNGAEFIGDVDFTGRKFKSTTEFGPSDNIALSIAPHLIPECATVFYGVPIFHECDFHQDTNFDSARFLAPPSRKAARAYRTLKLAMERLKATREEQNFFRLEMKAEHPSLPAGKRFVSTLYSFFSDYGFSLWRPLVWLIGLSVLFGIGYGVLANFCPTNDACREIAREAHLQSTAERTSAVIKYTLASVSPVPGLDRMQTELRAPLFGHHGWIPITALMLEILHKIVALVMAFLFALALRNLFKMKS